MHKSRPPGHTPGQESWNGGEATGKSGWMSSYGCTVPAFAVVGHDTYSGPGNPIPMSSCNCKSGPQRSRPTVRSYLARTAPDPTRTNPAVVVAATAENHHVATAPCSRSSTAGPVVISLLFQTRPLSKHCRAPSVGAATMPLLNTDRGSTLCQGEWLLIWKGR